VSLHIDMYMKYTQTSTIDHTILIVT